MRIQEKTNHLSLKEYRK
ncbi:hypothetical protein ACRS6Y_18385 [Bacillus cytotoxicus]